VSTVTRPRYHSNSANVWRIWTSSALSRTPQDLPKLNKPRTNNRRAASCSMTVSDGNDRVGVDVSHQHV
jgi:hypothetical protein